MPVVHLEPLDPFVGDTPETLRYRSCDYCHETAVEDVWAGRPWREFYRPSDCDLTVCGSCLAAHLSGE